MILAPILLALLQQPRPTPALPVRPRDPFVFRCVLDEHPRMITAALDDDLWVAWDATTCGLHKAWKGGVKFDGPVYTTVHGPQPTTRGVDYTTGFGESAWTAYQDGQPVACQARYGSYRIALNSVTIEWRIQLAGGAEVVVDEMPEFVRPLELYAAPQLDDMGWGEGKQPGLQRIFQARGLPVGAQINLTLRTDGAIGKLGRLERERFEDVKDERGNVTSSRVWSQLPLTHARPHNAVILFFAPVQVEPEPPANESPDKVNGEKKDADKKGGEKR